MKYIVKKHHSHGTLLWVKIAIKLASR